LNITQYFPSSSGIEMDQKQCHKIFAQKYIAQHNRALKFQKLNQSIIILDCIRKAVNFEKYLQIKKVSNKKSDSIDKV